MTRPGGGIWLAPPEPGDVSRVLEAVVASGPLGGGGTFSVDPERAEECIRQLEAVALNLTSARSLMDLAYLRAPGDDEVSENMAVQAALMADRAIDFIDTWRLQLADTATALAQQLRAYTGVDSATRDRLA